MDTNIVELLTQLIEKVAKHFNLAYDEALAAVAQSKTAEELCESENSSNKSIEKLSKELFYEIANAE